VTYVAAYLAGLGVLVAYFFICLAVKGTPKMWVLAEGQDGRLSTSKAQFEAWTIAVAFAYVAIFAARAVHGDHSALSTVPKNVLIALGFSVTTMASAKGIATAYVAQGRTPKPPAATSQLSDLVLDDTGDSDLSKTALLIWTLIAIGLFLVNVVYQVGDINANGPTAGNSSVPDIDSALLVLSGLAQGAYLGKKLVTANSVQVSGMMPTSLTQANAMTAGAVTIYGSGFGDVPAAAPPSVRQVVAPVPLAPVAPALPGAAAPQVPPTPVVPGTAVVPAPAPAPVSPPGCAVLTNGFQAVVDGWSDTQITFHLPPAHPSLGPLNPAPPAVPAAQVAIAVEVVASGQSGAPAVSNQSGMPAGNLIVVP
jgi:hypothetical protein